MDFKHKLAKTAFSTSAAAPSSLPADEGAEVASAYGSYGLKKFMGKEYMGISRSTFVIASDGTLEKIYRKVKAEKHPAELLAELDE